MKHVEYCHHTILFLSLLAHFLQLKSFLLMLEGLQIAALLFGISLCLSLFFSLFSYVPSIDVNSFVQLKELFFFFGVVMLFGDTVSFSQSDEFWAGGPWSETFY